MNIENYDRLDFINSGTEHLLEDRTENFTEKRMEKRQSQVDHLTSLFHLPEAIVFPILEQWALREGRRYLNGCLVPDETNRGRLTFHPDYHQKKRGLTSLSFEEKNFLAFCTICMHGYRLPKLQEISGSQSFKIKQEYQTAPNVYPEWKRNTKGEPRRPCKPRPKNYPLSTLHREKIDSFRTTMPREKEGHHVYSLDIGAVDSKHGTKPVLVIVVDSYGIVVLKGIVQLDDKEVVIKEITCSAFNKEVIAKSLDFRRTYFVLVDSMHHLEEVKSKVSKRFETAASIVAQKRRTLYLVVGPLVAGMDQTQCSSTNAAKLHLEERYINHFGFTITVSSPDDERASNDQGALQLSHEAFVPLVLSDDDEVPYQSRTEKKPSCLVLPPRHNAHSNVEIAKSDGENIWSTNSSMEKWLRTGAKLDFDSFGNNRLKEACEEAAKKPPSHLFCDKLCLELRGFSTHPLFFEDTSNGQLDACQLGEVNTQFNSQKYLEEVKDKLFS